VGNIFYGKFCPTIIASIKIRGIIFAEPFFEGVRRAGRNLTPETWISAMETLNNWQGIGPPVTYGKPTNIMGRQGGRHVFYGKVNPDGTVTMLTDWIQITTGK
jgi:hypothetical protein